MNREKSGSDYFEGLIKRDYIRKTQEIISNEGREAASIRRIAKEMKCSSASLYRYFENQSELIYYAELKQLAGYIRRLNEAQKHWTNIWDYYVGIWDCYCREAFRNPEVYDHLFMKSENTRLNASIAEGIPQKLEHNDLRWITVEEIDQYPFCPADEEILRRLKEA